MLRIGDRNKEVAELQCYLTHYSLGADALVIDGHFGDKTRQALLKFQSENGLLPDAVYGSRTEAAMMRFLRTNKRFYVSVHGGHGGINPETGEYDTKPSVGKRYQHKGLILHNNSDWFLEGVENRIIADRVAQKLREKGIFVLVTHHKYKCDYGNLSTHYIQTLPYIRNGYSGYTHAFHSNAVGSKIKDKNGKFIRYRTQAEKDAIRGCYVYTGKGFTFSDKIAPIHLANMQQFLGADWIRLRNDVDVPNSSSDAEANFQVIREIEALKQDDNGIILEEAGFFTSRWDAMKLTEEETRNGRVLAATKTALQVKEMLFLNK